jgi:hypothetical protein
MTTGWPSCAASLSASRRAWASSGPPAGLPQEGELQRQHVGALGVVGRAAVAALDVLPVQRRVALLQHARGHLAGVAGVHAVVAGAGGEQHARQLHARRTFW